MGYGEKRGKYWRGKYRTAPGTTTTVKDENGRTIRYKSRREAERAATAVEERERRSSAPIRLSSRISFTDYVNHWFEGQDLAESSMQLYRYAIECHLLPTFGEFAMPDIGKADVDRWEKSERALYADNSVKFWRKVLHVILEDAVAEEVISSNPAARRRNRGRRTGRVARRGKEKTITTALGVILIAERAALLSGRDDEFVAVVTKAFSGMRWGEMVGLEPQYVRPGQIRVEWQLYELDTGELIRIPPKDESRRDLHIPAWLHSLLVEHIARKPPQSCPCHGLKYVFGGNKAANGASRLGIVTLKDVAVAAGVSVGTVSNVLNRPTMVEESTRAGVEAAIDELGYVRGKVQRLPAAHWRRAGFRAWIFQPAVTGWYPPKAPAKARPVPVSADPWPGIPVRGRNAATRADACWMAIAGGMTPHSNRHIYKTLMEKLGTPKPLMDAQMGHSDGSVGALYSHVLQEMIDRLMDGLTTVWLEALAARRELCRSSAVSVLDRLLRGM